MPPFPNLDCLLDLTRHDGVDIRPTLLRVLTDLYVQRSHHMPHEARHYTELALRLIDAVDVPTRVAVAQRLACYPAAPVAVLERLARDLPEVAQPILRALPGLAPHAAGHRTTPGAAAPARAAVKPADVAREAPADAIETRAPGAARAAAAIVREAPTAVELSELFFSAGASDRRLILSNLEYAAAPAIRPIRVGRASDAVRRLELSALQNRPGEFARELEQVLEISREKAERIIKDPLGEPLLVAARALSMPAEVLQRVLLFVNPAIGLSVDRVYDLSAFYARLKTVSALRLVSIWRLMDAAEQTSRTYQSVFRAQDPRSARAPVVAPREPVRRDREDEALRPTRRQRTM
ncbi:MAG TPA: DUF2336 domain-containing protein [Xanthobacteraceae bacterium]|nr:DUF2336 domain-containing protein [Xanthobacteraceae bacterium]